VSYHSRVWGGAQAEIEFGAFLVKKMLHLMRIISVTFMKNYNDFDSVNAPLKVIIMKVMQLTL